MKRNFRKIVFVFSLLFFFLYIYSQKITVTGKVFGAEGPLHKATIIADSLMVFTDTAGQFSMKLDRGIHTIHVSYAGYMEIIQKVIIEAGNAITLDFIMYPDDMLKGVTLLGSRFSKQRSNLSTPVPVDVISSSHLLQTGQISLTQMLQFTIPSFNASRPLVNEPITLRGLDPDQVLILVNGKRYHNTAFVNWGRILGILGRGAVSNDLNSIPFPAIERIEILRDGASAQYGSDAIAGVINIRLKKSAGDTWAQLHTGQFYKSDGETVSLGINHGFIFFKKGMVNLSTSFRFQNPTYRGGEYKGTVYSEVVATDDSIVEARNFNRNNVSNAGTSKHNSFGFAANGTYPLGKYNELFWSVIFNHRTTMFTSYYVLPKFAFLINYEIYPDGFKPMPSNHTQDLSAMAGIKGETKNHWRWEYSYVYGKNRGRYFNKQTNNASQYYTLGENAPTEFFTGALLYGQLTNDIHVSKIISESTGNTLSVGIGGEWRLEHYRISDGEEASWKNYNPVGNKLGGSGGLVFSPYDVNQDNRSITAAYVEVESETADRLLISMATRYEYYSDFGSNLAGKMAARYKISEKIMVRSSVSNGFRAPSLQQRNMSFTRLNPSVINGAFVLVTQGIFRNNSEVAKALGIPSLHAERSINFSGGLTASLSRHIRFTLDAYWIRIKNRIVLSGVFDRRFNQDINRLLSGLTAVNQVQFFTNAIDTRTRGVDMIASGNWKIKKAQLNVMLGVNFTQTRMIGEAKKAGNLRSDSLNRNTLFGREEKGKLEKGQPSDKIIFSIQYKPEKFGLVCRATRFGRTAILSNNPVLNNDEYFSPKIVLDGSISYMLQKWLTVSLGANNIFNTYPDRLKDFRNTADGSYIYGQEATPFGFNGGYYFASMEIKW